MQPQPPADLTPEKQLERWATGESLCPNTRNECCPDFSCCRPKLGWPPDKRAKFMAAAQGEREKMLMGALGAAISDAGVDAYVTRGDPTDHE